MPAKKRVVYPFQLDPELDAKITSAAEALGESKAFVIRMALAIGLEHLRRINYDLASHLCQTPEPRPTLRVADEPGKPHSTRSAGSTKYPKRARKK